MIQDFITEWNLLSGWAFIVSVLVVIYSLGLYKIYLRIGNKVFYIYRYRLAFFAIGFLCLSTSLFGPFEAFADNMFWAHMVQHILLISIAAPLILVASPMPVLIWAFPRRIRIGLGLLLNTHSKTRKTLSIITKPTIALPLFIVTLWLWHYPSIYDAALRNTYIHLTEHFTMFTTAMLFWVSIVGPAPFRSKLPYPARMLYIVFAMTASSALAFLITFSDTVLYTHYQNTVALFNIPTKEDQTIAGLLLWLPGNFIYLLAISALFFKWASVEMKKT